MSLVPSSVPVTFRPDPILAKVAGWKGEQGASWAVRNPRTVAELDASYAGRFGTTRTQMARDYLRDVPRDARILEVGTSSGTQLEVLASIGYHNLHGCDINADALSACRFPAAEADVCALSYPDDAFDLVFTSGALMHVAPHKRNGACQELLRVTKRWVWGFECYHERVQFWTFGDLIPPAWGEPWPDRFLSFPVKPLRRDVHETKVGGNMRLSMYLLEKAR